MVPKERVTRLRMKLAEGGLPKGGGVGYEIFDKSDALGATSFVQNINHLRALEGELARTIRALDRVQAARVHLVLPERPLFSRDKAEPSASIVLKVRGALEPQQVRAIRHLVATAVNGLKPQRVSVVDETGRLLADGSADETAGRRRAPTSASSRSSGGCASRSNRSSPRWSVPAARGSSSPPISTSTASPRPRTSSTPKAAWCARARPARRSCAGGDARTAQVSVGNELPGAQQARQAGAAAQPRDQNRKTEEIVNYEISRTTKTEVIEGGRVNRISVAVVVDGNYVKNDKGELAYEPRSKEEIDRIAALVRTRHRLRPEARRPGRGRQPAARRNAADPDRRADRLDSELPAVHQGRRHARHRARA